jgi:hypothetical protein
VDHFRVRQRGFYFLHGAMHRNFIIDFLALPTKATLRLFGPLITLLIVQSKGWPFMLLFWGLFNFALVVGDSAFNNHWFYWQDWWGLFNEKNPSGDVTSSK